MPDGFIISERVHRRHRKIEWSGAKLEDMLPYWRPSEFELDKAIIQVDVVSFHDNIKNKGNVIVPVSQALIEQNRLFSEKLCVWSFITPLREIQSKNCRISFQVIFHLYTTN